MTGMIDNDMSYRAFRPDLADLSLRASFTANAYVEPVLRHTAVIRAISSWNWKGLVM